MVGGAGADTYMVDAAGDVVVEAASGGTDVVRASISYTLGENLEALELTGSAALNGTGNALNNTITGNNGNNSLSGEGGNDTLLGAAGNDTLLGAAGDDSLQGGDGADSLVGGGGQDTLLGGAGNDTLVVNPPDHFIVDGGAGNDLLQFVTNSGMTLGDGDFGQFSSIESFDFSGVAGDVEIAIGSNARSLGIATLSGGMLNSSLTANADYAGNVHFTGGAGADSLTGNSGNDSLLGLGGNDTLVGGTGNDMLDGGTGNDSMVGGAGHDTYTVDSATDLIVEAVGVGTDVVRASITFTLGANLEVLELTGSAALNGTGNSADNTIAGNTGNNVLSGMGGNDTLLGGDGNDSLDGGTGNDSMVGGTGHDTYTVDAAGDAVLEAVGEGFDLVKSSLSYTLGANLEALELTGSDAIHGTGNATDNSITGNSGNNSLFGLEGNDTILGGDGDDTLFAGEGNNSLLGGAGNDRFEFASGAQVLANTVVGGNGTDTLVLTAATTIADAQLARVSGVEAIQASSLAGNSITVGANAVAGGVLSLFGGASSDVLSAAGMVSGNIWIQGDAVGGTSTLGDTLIAGIGTSRATLVGNNSSTADNYFQISTASLLGNNSIVGGSNSDDYLQITGSNQTLLDASFAQVSDLNGLILSGGLNSITLGVTAQAKFGATISLTGGGSGADTINLSATTKKVYLDASAGSNGDTITAGTNENTLIGGAAATANDLFIFTSRSHLIGASIVGGGGTDTLRLSANGQTVASADLTGLSSVEVFDLAGAANNITFGNASYGISTIVGGTGPNTLNAASYNSSPNALTWNMNASNGSDVLLGGANGNLFQIKNGANLQNSFITGNTGIDTIQLLAGAQTLGDSAFTNISSVEKLQLGSATNGNSITIGTLAASKGIATVIGGTGRDTIDANGFGKGIWIDASASSGARLIGSTTAPAGNTLIGGAAGGNEFVVGALGANSIFGGSNGQDTLALSTAATIAAGNLTSLSKIGTLEFNAAGNNVVLGVDGLIAGIRTLVGGEGSDDGLGNTFDTSAYFSAGVLFQVTDQDYLSNVNAIVGSTGVDTLKFSRDGVSITDENVANLTNIDVLRTANGNNHFLIHNDFVAAGIDSIIGGTGRDTINMSDNSIYIPTGVADMITMDMSAGSGYTLISSTDDVLIPSQGNFRWAKVIGGLVAGSVILDGTNLADADFEYMYQANIGTLFMNQASDNTVVLGEKARGSGLDTLTMSDGNDNIDVTGFLGALAVNGGLGNDIVDTSFAALASLRFTGGDGDDTLRLVGAEARSITSLTGSYEAFALDDGNNFVVLANDAGLSTIHGGTGFDTISMLNNTTGIHFAMNAEGLGNGSGFASLDGGSGSDTLSLATAPVTFLDDQFSRLGSNAWVGDVGAIENFAAFQGGGGGNTYHFGVFAYAAGISRVYGSVGATAGNRDTFDGSIYGDDELPVRGLEFVFNVANDASGTTSDLSKTDIIGTAQQDTLTITENNQVVADSAFANKTNLEILRLANGSNNVTLNFNANNAGIATVIGGTGNDAFSTSAVAYTINARILGGAGNDVFTGGSGDDTFRGEAGNDTIDAGSGNNVLFGGSENDSLKGGVGIDWLCGTDTTALGANEIDTLTGGGGAGTNTFQLGDSVNTYYDTAKQGGDFALITDFASGDKLQLKLLNGAATGNGYLVGAALYGALGSSNYYLYRDSNNNGALEDGDNLIAGIQTTGGLVLTTANLKSTHGSFV
jgi:Ca2+-binding RTX toxin-like protein